MRELEQRHRDLSRTLHPDRFVHAPAGERRLALERAMAVNDAFRTMRDPLLRADALLALAGQPVEEGHRADPALLMEVMELREALEAARSHEKIATLREEVSSRIAREEDALAVVFDSDAPGPVALGRGREALIRLRYFRRFLEEAEEH